MPLNAVDLFFQRVDMGKNEAEMIHGSRVRGFLAGTTNPLLSQNARLAEVLVKTLPFDTSLEIDKRCSELADSVSSVSHTAEENLSDQSSIRSDISLGSGQHSTNNKPNTVFSKFMVILDIYICWRKALIRFLCLRLEINFTHNHTPGNDQNLVAK